MVSCWTGDLAASRIVSLFNFVKNEDPFVFV